LRNLVAWKRVRRALAEAVRASVGGGTTIECEVPVREDEAAPQNGAATLEART